MDSTAESVDSFLDHHFDKQYGPSDIPANLRPRHIDDAPLVLPEWLSSSKSPNVRLSAPLNKLETELLHLTFENMYDYILEQIALGEPLKKALALDVREPDYGKFLRWIHADEDRKNRYYEAQMIGSEIIADDMIEIADADDTIEDVQRSTLRINTRKYLLSVWNRKRYGDIRQVEQTVNVSIVDAMERAQQRLMDNTIDVTPIAPEGHNGD